MNYPGVQPTAMVLVVLYHSTEFISI